MTSKERVEWEVEDCLKRNDLVGKDALLVVGVSGGPDSIALCHSLISLQGPLGYKIHVAHLNHNFRGQEAYDDAQFVEEMSRNVGVPATVEKADPTIYQQERGISSFEEAARDVRYTFLGRVARESHASAVLVAHTADDQAETLLMHLLRGSGLHGLQGMQEFTTWRSPIDGGNAKILRPLLGVWRQEILNYCQTRNISYRNDTANVSLRFTRNRIRHKLMPALQGYNPRVKEALLRLTFTVKQEIQYLEEQVSILWPLVVKERDGLLILDNACLVNQHPVMRRLLFRRAYEHLKGDARGLEEIHFRSMEKIILGPAGRLLDLPAGLKLAAGYGVTLMGKNPESICPFPLIGAECMLEIPGDNWVSAWKITAVVLPQLPRKIQNNPFSAYLDYEVLGDQLTVRTRLPGDLFHPSGMLGSKKLQDFFVDSKVPRLWRDRVPLLVAKQGIAWVVGYRLASWAVADSNTTRVLHLRAVCDSVQLGVGHSLPDVICCTQNGPR